MPKQRAGWRASAPCSRWRGSWAASRRPGGRRERLDAGLEAFRIEPGKLLVLPVFGVHRRLRLGEDPGGLVRTDVGERGIADLVVGVLLEGNGRPRRVEPEGIESGRAHRRVEAEQRPVAARHREVLLLHAETHVYAVRDAVRVGKDERRAGIGLRLTEGLQGLLRIG